jgi:L-iditol 2-dehydrogenase
MDFSRNFQNFEVFMKAAVLVEPGHLVVKDVPMPQPGPDDVLIQVTLAGVCGSDASFFHGKIVAPLPVIPGHEAVGRIVECGENVTRLKVGQRVTIQPNFSCRTCPVCLAGRQNICPSKIRLGIDTDGVFAEYVKVPAAYVWPIPEALGDETAVFAEPSAVACHCLKILTPREGNRVLIFGAGVIGLLTLQLAKLHTAEITAYDINPNHLLLAQRVGASHIIASPEETGRFHNRFDVIYETSGAESALSQTIELAAPAAKIVLLGLPARAYPLSATMIVRKELQISGSIIYTDEFPDAIDNLLSGRIQTEPLISGRLSLAELNRSLSDLSSPDRVKMLVNVSQNE